MQAKKQQPTRISWARSDVERLLGFPGGRYTGVNTLFAAIIGCLLTAIFYAVLMPFPDSVMTVMFTTHSWVPYAIVFFFSWSIGILGAKWLKVSIQKQTLQRNIVPDDPQFVLSGATVDEVTDNIYAVVDNPSRFVLFNRIIIALSNLKNLGRVTDVDDILRSQAENDESSMETSYLLLNGFIWTIPVLGFIGTVLGLSKAIGGFTEVLNSLKDFDALKNELGEVTHNLSTAFVTTLQALVAALIIQLLVTFLKKTEEEFLDACAEYCIKNIVNRLRVMPFQVDSDD